MIKRCLVIKPEERTQSADELLRILKESNVAGAREDIVPPPVVDQPSPITNQANIPPSSPEKEDNDGKTEIMPGRREQSNPPIHNFKESPAPDYGMPRPNVTQVVKPRVKENTPGRPTESSPPPPPVTRFEPKTGEPSSGFKWWWLLVPLLLAGIGGGTYWYLNVYEPESKKEEPFDDGVSLPLPENEYFASQDEAIEDGQKEPEEFLLLLDEVIGKQSEKEHKDNYRLPYLEAKIYAYQGDIRKAAEALKRAAKMAITSPHKNDTKKMIEDMKLDERSAFLRLRKLQNGKYWNPLVEALQKSR